MIDLMFFLRMNWQVWCNLLVVAAVAATSEAMRETRQGKKIFFFFS